MRRALSFSLGALACVALASGGSALAQENPDPTTTTSAQPTTTTSIKPTTTTGAVNTPTTAGSGGTTTTTRTGTGTTTTTRGTGNPIPPPASGPSQPLDPSILGGTPLVDTSSTTLFGVETVTVPQQTTPDPQGGQVIATSKNAPSGTTLVLAAVAWLASLGGLLVYAEDQRGQRWRHLAR